MISKLICMFIVMGCLGCNSNPIYKTQEVDIPIVQKCKIEWPDEPIEYTKQVNEQSLFLNKANAFISENKERKVYEEKLKAAIQACIE